MWNQTDVMMDKMWMVFVQKYMGETISDKTKTSTIQMFSGLTKSCELLMLHSKDPVSRIAMKSTRIFGPRPRKCETTKRITYSQRVFGSDVTVSIFSPKELSGIIADTNDGSKHNFCPEPKNSNLGASHIYCTNLWTFRVHGLLALQLEFLIIYFVSSDFDCCKGNVVVSNVFEPFHSEASFHNLRSPDMFVFCGHQSHFSLYPGYDEVQISRSVQEFTIFHFTLLFQVQDRNRLISHKSSFKKHPNLVIKETNWIPSVAQSQLLLHITTEKNFYLAIVLVDLSSVSIHDGPSAACSQVELSRQTYFTTSFQCVIQMYLSDNADQWWLNGSAPSAAITKHVQFISLKQIPQSRLLLNQTRYTPVTLDIRNTQIITVLKIQCAPQGYINLTFLEVHFVGQTDRITCMYGGIVVINSLDNVQEEIASPICESQFTFGAKHRFYSNSSSVVVVRYWYETLSFIGATLLISTTQCKPVHINECKIDYWCHCSTVFTHDVCLWQGTKSGPSFILRDVGTWPQDGRVCAEYLEQIASETGGNVSFRYNAVESGRSYVGSLLLSLSRETPCVVIKMQRTANQLSDLRRGIQYGPMLSSCELQLRSFIGHSGTVYHFDIYGQITPTNYLNSRGKERILLYGQAGERGLKTAHVRRKSRENAQFSELLAKFRSKFFQLDSDRSNKNKNGMIQMSYKERFPHRKLGFAIYVSLLSQLMGSWIDVTIWRHEEGTNITKNISECFKQTSAGLFLFQEAYVQNPPQTTKVVKIVYRHDKATANLSNDVLIKYSSLVDGAAHKMFFYGRTWYQMLFLFDFYALFSTNDLVKYFSFPLPGPFTSTLTLLSPSEHSGPSFFDIFWISDTAKEKHHATIEPTCKSVHSGKHRVCCHFKRAATSVPFFLWFGYSHLFLDAVQLVVFGFKPGKDENRSSLFEKANYRLLYRLHSSLLLGDDGFTRNEMLSWNEAYVMCAENDAVLPYLTSRDVLEEFITFVKYSPQIPFIEAAYIGVWTTKDGVCI